MSIPYSELEMVRQKRSQKNHRLRTLVIGIANMVREKATDQIASLVAKHDGDYEKIAHELNERTQEELTENDERLLQRWGYSLQDYKEIQFTPQMVKAVVEGFGLAQVRMQ